MYFRFLISRSVEVKVSALLSFSICGDLLQQPGKPMHPGPPDRVVISLCAASSPCPLSTSNSCPYSTPNGALASSYLMTPVSSDHLLPPLHLIHSNSATLLLLCPLGDISNMPSSCGCQKSVDAQLPCIKHHGVFPSFIL